MATLVDETAVRARLAAGGYAGIVSLIDYLAQRRSEGREVWWIGSSTIFGNESRRPKTLEETMALPSWSLGSKRGRRLPIEDIADFTDDMLQASFDDGRFILDTLCKDLACSDEASLQVMLSKSEIIVRLAKAS